MTGNAVAVREENAFELGKVFAESGMFPNVRKASEAVVKIIAGREFGLGPMAAMNGIHMIEGKPTLAANLIAGQIKRHPQYDYKVIRRDDTGCEIEFLQIAHDGRGWPSLGKMTFDRKDAERAGLLGKQNWKKYPRDMYFARCLTAGARTYCPDVLGGSPIYTAEELGADGPESAPAPVSGRPVDVDDGTINHAASAEHNAGAVVTDAEIVDDDKIGTSLLGYLRELYQASGMSRDDLAFCLLSVGVTSMPESPTSEDIGTAMRGLTVEQAKQLEPLLKTDDAVPGSGETA